LRIQDAATGQTLTAVSEVGNQSTLFEMVARAGDRVRQELGARAPTQEQARQAASSVSPTLRAVQQYAEGMQKLRNYDALGARELLQEAVRSDPNYAAAHSSLSEALSNLGYDRNSREEAKIAFELSGPLSQEGQLSIEGRYRLATADWQGA